MDSLILYFFRPLWSLDGYKPYRRGGRFVRRWLVDGPALGVSLLARGTLWTRLLYKRRGRFVRR